MPIKHYTKAHVFFILIASLLLIFWLKFNDLADYAEQVYQLSINRDVAAMGVSPALQKPSFAALSQQVIARSNQLFFAEELARQRLEQEAAKLRAERRREVIAAQIAAERTANLPKVQVELAKGDTVFFVGDSLMQGVAPFAMKTLTAQGVKSIDLSKQSTGLTYDKFLDWRKTVQATFDGNNIALMVVLFGPNDVWDISNPQKPSQLLKYGTPDWAAYYQQKMRNILTIAEKNGAQVLWVLPPNAKRAKLSADLQTLRTIMQAELDLKKVVVVNAQSVLGDNDTDYFDSLTIDGTPTKLRTGDGIHFTGAGQKRLAAAVTDKIAVKE